MRILKFIGAFLGTFLIIFLIVFGFNLNALFTLFENADDIQEGQEWVTKTFSLKGLTEYIGAQPERVSIVSLAIENPDSSILYNEHTPRTIGRLSNIFLLIEYAKQAEKKSFRPARQIALSEVDAYQLPFIDASNHSNAIESLRDRGKISSSKTIALANLVQIAVEYNDLAVSDYLYFTIGRERIEALLDQLKLKETELPLPFSGLYIVLNPSLYHMSFKQRMDSLSTMPRTDFDRLVINASRKFVTNKTFRQKVLKHFEEDEGLGISFAQQRDLLKFFPKSTALEMAGIMKKLQQEKLISKDVSRRVKATLSWPMKSSRLDSDFKNYGAIYDSRLGLVNGIDYGQSTYSEEPFAQAVFFDDLQVAFWFHMSSNLMHQDFEQRLIWDPALRQATVKEIMKKQ